MADVPVRRMPRSDTRSRKDLEFGIIEALLGVPITRLCPCNTLSEKDLLYNILLAAQEVGGGLPDQTGHAGEFLTTDGATASWAAVSGGGTVFTFDAGVPAGGDGAVGDVRVDTDTSIIYEKTGVATWTVRGQWFSSVTDTDGFVECPDTVTRSATLAV